jgi:cyclomaltodextrinase
VIPDRKHGTRRGPGCGTTAAWAGLLLIGTLATVPAVADWPPAPPLQVAVERDPGSLPPSVTAEPLGDGRWRCTFRYVQQGQPQRVNLAGTFNGWSSAATPMDGPSNGTWQASAVLDPGKHLYKFVIDGERWVHDRQNPLTEHDGHDGLNSVLRLGRVANLTEAAARTGDGRIEGLALEHRPESPRYYQRLGDNQALLRVRTLADDVERTWVAVQGAGQTEMTLVDEDGLFALWEATVTFPPALLRETAAPEAAEIQYTFVLADGDLRASSPATYGVPVLQSSVFHTPNWAKHAIWYQIMLDRFRNGDPSNDREPVRPWTSDWFTPSPWEGQDGQTFYKFYVFDRQYGGDLKGLIDQLPYLEDLGVNAIYLNPVFKAESHHKYNAETYLHIDDHFGVKGDYDKIKDQEDHTDPSTWVWTESDKLFLDFLKRAHERGLKVIIDGVFNHVGTAHPAFQDVLKNGRDSRYADWFDVTSWDPFEYNGWAGHGELPVFKKAPHGFASDSVKEYIFNVTRRWMDPDGDGDPSDGIDGWRLDVPNEVAAPFWVEWRDVVKSVNPDAYITGEIWDRAEMWLDGKHFDAVMNYEFAKAVVAWNFNKRHKISPSEFDRQLRELRLAYPREATLALQNLMNSHDTDRVASMAFNPDRAFDNANRIQDNGPNYNNDKPDEEAYRRVRLALSIMMTYVGAPMVYYGDEVGMWGADDPTCRKPMLWKDLEPYEKPEENFVMEDHLAHYKQMIALRNAHPALRIGAFQTLTVDDTKDIWAFLRKDPNEQLVCVFNASGKPADVTIPLPPSAPNAWRGVYYSDRPFKAEAHKLRITVPPIDGVVLHAETPK